MKSTTRSSIMRGLVAATGLLGAGILIAIPTLANSAPAISNSTSMHLAQTQSVGNLVQVLSNDDSFNTLVRAVQAAGLADTLSTQGPFTVFAPTDQAFDNLPAGQLDTLLKPENRELLRSILLYHVAQGEIQSGQLQNGGLKTLGGGLAVRVLPDRVFINDSTVVKADIPASNGVIHAIDRVLMPRELRAELEARTAGAQPQQSPGAVRGLW
jgi:uncharacterized surface protein with fasciclin (FAS1) repeats